MLTPLFVCTQDEVFIIVAITLSALCKVSTAVFDILEHQFTFHCSPYYLRLRFEQRLTEGCGERATFAVDTNVLTVYLPKERRGESFTQLDNPAFLLATEVERRRLVQLVHGPADPEEEEEEEDTEFRQELPAPFPTRGGDYGFAGTFSGLFAALDADVVAEILDVPRNPDETTPAERRAMRLAAENADFDEDALLCSFEDADGEVRRLLGASASGHPRRHGADREVSGAEEAEGDVDWPHSASVEVWAGNVAEFGPPPPPPALSTEDQTALQRLRAPRLLFAPSASAVGALTLDLLLSERYDHLVTDGTGCCESLWNVCKLSPALSWLDPADNTYDACRFFARRALVYPLHRHMGLVQRVFVMVAGQLALGRAYVMPALLRLRALLAHAEHRHVLVTLFLSPLLGYWATADKADERLRCLANELRCHATRTRSEMELEGKEEEGATSVLIVRERRQLLPLTLLTLGLPISE